jgi:HEAT repeats
VLGAAPTVRAQHEVAPEAWVEMRKMFRTQGPAPSVEADVAALAGPDARRAGPRLIDRGPEVLPAVHAALLAPDVEPRHALALLQVMRPLADASSVPVLLELLRRDPKSPLRRDALLVLAMLPATDEAAAFAGELAADTGEPWRTRRMAFTWYGLHRDPRGRPFAEALRDDPDPERRVAALYVLARLGDATALEPITRILAAGAPADLRDALLLALAELVPPEEFERRAPASLAWSGGYRDALRYTRYRAATTAERPALCREMLRAEMPGHLELGVRCLLEAGRADELRPAAALDLEAPGRAALVRNEIRRAGWRVVDSETEFRIEPASPHP